MNRIERRFKREIGKNIESFDAWAEKHREELAAVGVVQLQHIRDADGAAVIAGNGIAEDGVDLL